MDARARCFIDSGNGWPTRLAPRHQLPQASSRTSGDPEIRTPDPRTPGPPHPRTPGPPLHAVARGIAVYTRSMNPWNSVM